MVCVYTNSDYGGEIEKAFNMLFRSGTQESRLDNWMLMNSIEGKNKGPCYEFKNRETRKYISVGFHK